MVRTAQAAFEVIGQNGKEILVCLDDHCREWLDAYTKADSYGELILAQQMLQQYMVNLAYGDYKNISLWISHYENRRLSCSIEVLENNEVYGPDCGVCPVQDEDLIF